MLLRLPPLLAAFLAALLAALLLAACQSLPTPPKEPQRYDLGIPDANALTEPAEPTEPAALVLTDIQAPWQAEGSTTAMYYRLAYAQPHNLHAYSQASWSLPPQLLVQERLRYWLSQGQRVVLSAEGGRIPPGVDGQQPPVLLLALEEFEQVFDQPAHSVAKVRLRATLLAHQPAGEMLLGQQVFSITTPAASADAAGGARALSEAMDTLGQQLVAWLRQRAGSR